MSLLVRNGLVLAPEGLIEADVLIDGGVVTEVAPNLVFGDQIVDATGCLVGPGFVDIHTHLREPGETDKEGIASASRAAAAGGFTAVVAMPNTNPPLDRPSLVRWVRDRGDEAGLTEVSAAASLTEGRSGEEAVDVEALYASGARIFTDDGDSVADKSVLSEIMERASALPGAVIAQHAEARELSGNGHMHQGEMATRLGVAGIPAEAEVVVVARDLELARRTGARYHCQHVSSARTVELVREAKMEGLKVTAEVTPHHLSFDESHLENLDTNFKMYPPLRGANDRAALMSALRDGTIDVVATDHAPHTMADKARGFTDAPRGVIGLETAAAAVWAMTEDPQLLFQCLSTRPAAIASLTSQGRRLAKGEHANIVVFDPKRSWRVEHFDSMARNSPYLGMTLTGRVVATIFAGAIVHELRREHV